MMWTWEPMQLIIMNYDAWEGTELENLHFMTYFKQDQLNKVKL